VENSLLVSLSRQMALRREIDVVANNIANMGTNGFKAEGMTFAEFIMPVARDNTFPAGDRRLSYVEDKATWHDFGQGAQEITGNPLDVAIANENGFLVVQTPGGERYTRNGGLLLNNEGTLVTSEGHPVLTTNGAITFTTDDRDITIAQDGSITTAQGDRGRLRVASFPNPQTLVKQGSSLFSATEAPLDIEAASVRLKQGAIEKANVNSVGQMTRMIEIERAYQSLASLSEKTDQLRSAAIQRLAEIPS
jgi:flagellar basal-body rod protein FlgF